MTGVWVITIEGLETKYIMGKVVQRKIFLKFFFSHLEAVCLFFFLLGLV